ncbi:hypothetical protein Tco_0864315 [Tanacetum coccineum]
MASDIHRLICRWWGLPWSPLGSYAEWLSWFKDIRLGSKVKSILEGVCYVSCFNDFVTFNLNSAPSVDSNGMRNLAGKLKFLKAHIKIWIKDNKSETVSTIANLKKELNQLDAVIDKGTGLKKVAFARKKLDFVDEWLSLLSEFGPLLTNSNSLEGVDIEQKSIRQLGRIFLVVLVTIVLSADRWNWESGAYGFYISVGPPACRTLSMRYAFRILEKNTLW